ncbi:MAG: hypothetical protein U0Y08_03980 [Bacteroidia bacterium]
MFRIQKIIYIIGALIYISLKTHAQFTNNNWCFGDSAGVRFDSAISIFRCGTGFTRGTATISDINGDLIFYGATSNTTNEFTGQIKQGKLFNKYHTELINGDTLVGGNWYHCMLVLPKSIIDSTFYVFVAGVVVPDTGLWYSIVDMKLQGGVGAVVQKNVRFETHPVQDMLTAVKHGNGKDWWLVTRRWRSSGAGIGNDEFWVYLVDSIGIHPLAVQHIGTSNYNGAGDMSFNSTGDKLALCGWGNYLGVFDFDRCTGQISNETLIEPNTQLGNHPYRWYTSVVFSPSGQFLYVNSSQEAYQTSGKLYQFDLTATNIATSRVLIDSFPTNAENHGMELGPDGKIYISAQEFGGCTYPWPSGCFSTINSNLSVINSPDSLGSASNFQLFALNLGGYRAYRGLPNNPDYELGAWVGSPCDTLTVGLTPGPSPEERGAWLQAWYNHEWNMIHVNAAQLKGKKGMLRLMDIEGRIVFEKPAAVLAGGYYTTEIYMNELSSGVYVVNLVTDRETLSFKTSKF